MSDDSYDDAQTSGFVGNNIVRIVDKVGQHYGTGFFIELNKKKYCITCHHCICSLDQIFIEKGNTQYLCKWVEEYSDMKKDIAVLSTSKNTSLINPLKIGTMLPGLKVFTWGFSSTNLHTFPKGSIIDGSQLSEAPDFIHWEDKEWIDGKNDWNKKPDVDLRVYKFGGNIDVGFSGAPVCYDVDKKVIGIFFAKDDNNGYAIPIQTLLDKSVKDILLPVYHSTELSEYLDKGNLFFWKKEFNSAIKEYNKIIKDVNYLSALNNKGVTLHHLNEYREAIECYDKVLEIDPNDLSALFNKGIALDHLRKYKEAIEWYDKALDIEPNKMGALENKGSALANLKNYKEAIEWYDKALKLEPNNVDILTSKCNALADLKKYEKAIDCYNDVLKREPEFLYVWYEKGNVLAKLKSYKAAIDCYNKVLKIDSKNEEKNDPKQEEVFNKQSAALDKLQKNKRSLNKLN